MALLRIKNMVCDRCITTVRDLIEEAGYEVCFVELGKAEITEDPSSEDIAGIARKLRSRGFELITEQQHALVEEIRARLIDYLDHIEAEEDPQKVSDYLAEQLHHNYSYLSSRFSTQTNYTIEQYLIQLKIERVKELLSYEELTLSEIAWKLNYSSVQYLSNQFKKITGETVSSFRQHLDTSGRRPLDAV